MRALFIEAHDFNRILVFSVFFHLSFLIVVMFLPKREFRPDVVVPAFMVNLIELPPSMKSRIKQEIVVPQRAKPQVREPKTTGALIEKLEHKNIKNLVTKDSAKPQKVLPEVKELETTMVVIERPEQASINSRRIKGGPIPKKAKPEVKELETTRALLIDSLNQLSGKANATDETFSNPLLRELDKLAQLTSPSSKKKIVPKKNRTRNKALEKLQELKKKKSPLLPSLKSWKLKKTPVVEGTLDELKRQSEELKEQKISPKKFEIPNAVIAKKTLEKSRTKTRPQIKSDFDEDKLSEMKFAELSTELKNEKNEGQTLEELLVELEAMPDSSKDALMLNKEKAIEPVLEKMASLVKLEKSIEIKISTANQKEFISAIGKQKAEQEKLKEHPKREAGQEVQKGLGPLTSSGDRESTDILSMYVGSVHKRIYEHWKTPLGTEHDDMAEVSFYLYPKGNIDKPVLVKASHEDKLNTLAIQAIYDSEPFLEFPKNLKEPSLHIKVNFKYKPANE